MEEMCGIQFKKHDWTISETSTRPLIVGPLSKKTHDIFIKPLSMSGFSPKAYIHSDACKELNEKETVDQKNVAPLCVFK